MKKLGFGAILLAIVFVFVGLLIRHNKGVPENLEHSKELGRCTQNSSEGLIVKLQPINCSVPEKFQTIHMPCKFVQYYNIANYKKLYSEGSIINKSDRSKIQIKVTWPNMTAGDKGPITKKEVMINLSTYDCNKKSDFDQLEIILNFVKQVDNKGKPYYEEKKEISDKLSVYSSLSNKKGYDQEIYLYNPDTDKSQIIVRCDKDVCTVESFPFLYGYLLSYTFNAENISQLDSIHNAVLKFMNTKFY